MRGRVGEQTVLRVSQNTTFAKKSRIQILQRGIYFFRFKTSCLSCFFCVMSKIVLPPGCVHIDQQQGNL